MEDLEKKGTVEIDEEGNIVNPDDSTGKNGADDTPKLDENGEPIKKETPKDDVDEHGVPWKNRAKEQERKRLEAEKLNAQLLAERKAAPPAPKTDRIEAYRKKLKEAGYSEAEIAEKVEVLQIAIDEAGDRTRAQLGAVSEPLNTVRETVESGNRTAILNQFEKNAKIGALVKKYRKDIESEMSQIPLSDPINAGIIQRVIANTFLENDVYITPTAGKGTKLKDEEIISEGQPAGTVKVGGFSIDKLKEFASEHSLKMDTPDQKAKVAKAYKSKLELDKLQK